MIKLSSDDLETIEAIKLIALNFEHSNEQVQEYIEKAADLLGRVSDEKKDYYDWANLNMKAHEKIYKEQQ